MLMVAILTHKLDYRHIAERRSASIRTPHQTCLALTLPSKIEGIHSDGGILDKIRRDLPRSELIIHSV